MWTTLQAKKNRQPDRQAGRQRDRQTDTVDIICGDFRDEKCVPMFSH